MLPDPVQKAATTPCCHRFANRQAATFACCTSQCTHSRPAAPRIPPPHPTHDPTAISAATSPSMRTYCCSEPQGSLRRRTLFWLLLERGCRWTLASQTIGIRYGTNFAYSPTTPCCSARNTLPLTTALSEVCPVALPVVCPVACRSGGSVAGVSPLMLAHRCG